MALTAANTAVITFRGSDLNNYISITAMEDTDDEGEIYRMFIVGRDAHSNDISLLYNTSNGNEVGVELSTVTEAIPATNKTYILATTNILNDGNGNSYGQLLLTIHH